MVLRVLRASVRAPRGFAVDQALNACAELLDRHGGHPAAGGFTVRAEHVAALQERLERLARQWLGDGGAARLVEPEALLALERIDRGFFGQLRRLEPFGIGNPAPLFWSCGCEVDNARLLRGGHLQLELRQGTRAIRALAWRWQGQDLPGGVLDVAYHLNLDRWQGQERLQLELVALRPRRGEEVVLQRRNRSYWCRRDGEGLVIRNAEGEERRLAMVSMACQGGQTGRQADDPGETPALRRLFHDAAMALGLTC